MTARPHVAAPALDEIALVSGGLSLLAATIHAGLAPDHFHHAAWLGALFVLAAAAQTAWALAALAGRGPVTAGVALNLACVAAWLLSRTAGLPGLGVEPVGVLDVLTAGVELSLCGLLLRARGALGSGLVFACALVCLLASGMAGHA